MQVTASMVKELREKTGAGMMDCKKALTEANGDIEAAVDYLRKKGMAAAAKKAGRITSEGLVSAMVTEDGKQGVVVEVNCESDFVAKNPDFIKFTEDLQKHIIENKPANMDECLAQTWIGDASVTVKDAAAQMVGVIGENISPRRFEMYEVQGEGLLDAYVHMGGKLGVLVEVGTTKADTAKNDTIKDMAHKMGMQIAAAMPVAVTEDEVPADAVERERAIYKDQVAQSGKPEKMWDKIVDGKMKKYFKDACLLEQAWVHDTNTTVKGLLGTIGKELDDTVTVRRFARMQLGEGLEKRSNDLASEVAEQLNKG